ncbi:UDP-glucoronosyl and UDP-glucosyl transferase [Ancylostoma caninum]|uniref:glucuronosyltransferase n=1 Tax=Ancylostoma caninum TaxID=29170 RepID=A0A368H8C0_ANCCA|nr:UDP-glucoronosyl and UDP-glucosyl transferase [Ancylostoma caninum]
MFRQQLLLVFCLQLADSYKILIYSAPLGYSHIHFLGRIADILQQAGHDVTVLHQVQDSRHVYAVSTLTKQILHELPEDLKDKMRPKSFNLWSRGSTSLFTHLSFVDTFTQHQADACDLLLSDNRIMEILKNERFDVGITETIGACGFGLFERAGVDHIICASAIGVTDSMVRLWDLPSLPSIVPSIFTLHTDKMDFFERTVNFISTYITTTAAAQWMTKYERVWERYGSSLKMRDYYEKVNYLLSNSDEFLDFARPTTAKIVHIGGVTIPEKTELAEEFRVLMEREDRIGVVYISFGSFVPTKQMPSYFREAIFHVVRTFPRITFIWKTDANDTVPTIPNLRTFTWLPQLSILDHPNLLCFVSHGGLNSVLELTRSGKPSILVPIFGDQFRNARLVMAKNTTVLITKEDFNSESFEAALRRILSDDSFAVRAKRLASLMVNKPFPLKERLLSTVEFSTRHGKISNLDINGRHLYTLQYYSVDVVAFLATLFVLILLSFIQLCKFCLRVVIVSKLKRE